MLPSRPKLFHHYQIESKITMLTDTPRTPMSTADLLERRDNVSQRVAQMFRDAGSPSSVDGALSALANGTPADDLGMMAVAMAANSKEGVDFCPLFRGEYQQVSDIVSCSEEEYVQMRCDEERVAYHA